MNTRIHYTPLRLIASHTLISLISLRHVSAAVFSPRHVEDFSCQRISERQNTRMNRRNTRTTSWTVVTSTNAAFIYHRVKHTVIICINNGISSSGISNITIDCRYCHTFFITDYISWHYATILLITPLHYAIRIAGHLLRHISWWH
jgi:hypothetical protein